MTTQTVSTPSQAASDAPAAPVVVEEELLLIDRSTGRPLPMTGPVAAALAPVTRLAGGTVTLTASPATSLVTLREEMLHKRRAVVVIAAQYNAHLVAAGYGADASPTVVPTAPVTCGLTVHVGVPDRTAVQVCRRLHRWLPLIGALTANSPFHTGTYTGHASWRFVEVHRRALGAFVPSPRSAGFHREISATVEAAEARLPAALRYWHARPAPGTSAVQVRVGDAGLSIDDTIAAVGLLRAAVMHTVATSRTGRPGMSAAPAMVDFALWQAARQGLTGRLTDPHTGRLTPAWQLLDRFTETVLPADADHEPVRAGLARLRGEGTGAERQRRVLHRIPDTQAAVAELARLTTQG